MAIRVENLRDAQWAQCRKCGCNVEASAFWGLSQCMWLHSHGAKECQDAKFWLWAVT